jgi:hypothetical protein
VTAPAVEIAIPVAATPTPAPEGATLGAIEDRAASLGDAPAAEESAPAAPPEQAPAALADLPDAEPADDVPAQLGSAEVVEAGVEPPASSVGEVPDPMLTDHMLADPTLATAEIVRFDAEPGHVLLPALWVDQGAGTDVDLTRVLSPEVSAIDLGAPGTFLEDPSDWARRPVALQGLTPNQIAELFGFRAAEGALLSPASPEMRLAQSIDFEFVPGFPYVAPKDPAALIGSDLVPRSSFGHAYFDATSAASRQFGNTSPGLTYVFHAPETYAAWYALRVDPNTPVPWGLHEAGGLRVASRFEDLYGYHPIDRWMRAFGPFTASTDES